jgi:hypothetical protein
MHQWSLTEQNSRTPRSCDCEVRAVVAVVGLRCTTLRRVGWGLGFPNGGDALHLYMPWCGRVSAWQWVGPPQAKISGILRAGSHGCQIKPRLNPTLFKSGAGETRRCKFAPVYAPVGLKTHESPETRT